MDTREKDALLSFLFGEGGMELKNIKFFRGDKDVITEAEFCHQVHSALQQKNSGRARADTRFNDIVPQIELKQIVASL